MATPFPVIPRQATVIAMLDAYAADPMGDGRPLSEYARTHLIRGTAETTFAAPANASRQRAAWSLDANRCRPSQSPPRPR